MDTDTKKRSKAFYITFFVVIVLLIVGYFLLFRNGGVFSTKGTSSEQKSFFPLLGSSKKTVTPVETPTAPGGVEINTETSTDGAVPLFNPIPGPNGKSPIVTLSATPKVLDTKGGKVKLVWRGENVTSCIPSWTGKKTTKTSGTSSDITLTKPKLFSIACTNGVSTASATAQVSIVGATTLGISLFANPSILDTEGKVRLSWTSNTSTKSCTPSWTNKKSDREGDVSITVSESKTFSISCTDGTTTEFAEVDVVVTDFYSNITECNDGLDNDADKNVDIADSGCHADFDETNESSYNPKINSESRAPIAETDDHCKALDENPLKFTDAEKRKLNALLRQFYRIAPLLKTQDDINDEYSAKEGYIDLYKEAVSLTKQCYDQQYPTENNAARVAIGATPNYTGPLEKKTNPYFAPDGVQNSTSYITQKYRESKFTSLQNALIANQMVVINKLDAKAKSATTNAQKILFAQLIKYEQTILDGYRNVALSAGEFEFIEKILQIW